MLNSLIYSEISPKNLKQTLVYNDIKTKIGSGFLAINQNKNIVFFGFYNEARNPEAICRNYFRQCQFVKGDLPRHCLQKSTIELYGTSFQLYVWQALLTVSSQTPVSYQHIATFVDSPQATRAVANAVAKNPVSGLIPCHRIVYKSGKIGNYAWGTPVKIKLLELEKKHQSWFNN